MNLKNLILILGLGMVFVLSGLMVQKVAAATGPGGRNACQGYFTGATRCPLYGSGYIYGQVISCGFTTTCPWGGQYISPNDLIPGITNKQTFINYIEAKYATGGNGNNRVGAAFIIQLMRGQSSGWHYPTPADIADWRARIMAPSITIRYVYAQSYNGWNSGYMNGPVDDAFYPDNSNASALVFYNGNTPVFAIKAVCGNPLGNFPAGLPPAAPNHPPVGTITGACTPSGNGQVTVTMSDPDGPTSGYVTNSYAPWATFQVSNGKTYPLSSGYGVGGNRVQFDLYVRDVGPSAPPGTYKLVSYTFVGPCATQACGQLTPTTVEPQQSFSLTGGVTISGGSGLPPTAKSGSITISQNGVAMGSWTSAPPLVFGQTSGTYTVTKNGVTVALPGQYDVTWTETVGALPPMTCTGSFLAAYKPYFQVAGGDVMAGSGFDWGSSQTSGMCTANSSAGVVSWNKRATTYGGAGTGMAAYAMSQIQDFATGQGSVSQPVGLAFSNQAAGSVNLGAGLFGGMFGNAPCVYASPPSTATTLKTAGTLDVSSLTSGAYSVQGPIALISGQIQNGQHITLYVNGDAYIASNIAYNATGWSGLSSIPSFRLIAYGNIYVGSTVTQLDGSYEAVPTAYTTGYQNGNIYTCSTDTAGTFARVSRQSPTYYAACNSPLTINGSFTANQVWLLRTAGSLNGARGNGVPAEQFVDGPETWLAPSGGNTPDSQYRSITSLPPVL